MRETTDSSFLYITGEGKQRFVHDTYSDFLAVRTLAEKVNQREKALAEGFELASQEGVISKEFFLCSLEKGLLHERFYRIMHDNDLLFRLGVHDIYLCSNGDKVVICIDEDNCYCNPDAQRPIEEILSYIDRIQGVDLVAVEAAAGKFDLSPFTGIDNPVTRRKVAESFLEKGQLSGADMFGIFAGRDILWGVEDTNTYLRAAKGAGMFPNSTYKGEGDVGAKFERHNYWAKNTIEESQRRDAYFVALVFSNTSSNFYKEMAGQFADAGYSSLLVTHKGPRGLGKNYWKLARGEPVDEEERKIREILGRFLDGKV